MKQTKEILIDKINKSSWWHVAPRDSHAYKKRGKFLASTYLQAAFYGRPNETPEKVQIKNPIFGFSEIAILKRLFGKLKGKLYLKSVLNVDTYEARIGLDAKMYRKAKQLGYDAIVLMAKNAEKALVKGKKPNSIELNLLNI